MQPPANRPDPLGARNAPRDVWALAVFLATCLGIGGLGAVATASSVGTWYQSLHKPAITPPDWLFGPVWTLLYVMIAMAGWLVWRAPEAPGRKAALTAYATQLALNLAWSFLFFGARMIGVALADILLLLAAVLVNVVRFWRIDRIAAALLVPYALWVAFASVLTFALWRLN